jgi:formamidopyrimidine-DNA glycosylase
MTDEYIRKQNAVGAVEFGITLASAINIETGERTELFQRENDELREAVKRIKDIEPADVVQVVHSQWIKTADGAECENCGREAVYQIIDGRWQYEPWCPHCGAKMDGGDEHG